MRRGIGVFRFTSAIFDLRSSIFSLGEHVSAVADGDEDAGGVGGVGEFFAEAGDEHVDGAGGDAAGVDLPDVFQQLLAGDRATRMAGEM